MRSILLWLAFCLLVSTSCDATSEEAVSVEMLESIEQLDGMELQRLRRQWIDMESGKLLQEEEVSVTQIRSSQGLSAFLSGSTGPLRRIVPSQVLQEVPGVPVDPRFEGVRFEEIRRSFSPECANAAGTHRNSVANLLVGNESGGGFEAGLALARAARVGENYEAACLTPLAKVPEALRRVVGVFAVNGYALCSGTIVGRNTILTAKHCLIDPATGGPGLLYELWLDGNLTFHTPVAHGARSEFSVIEPTPLLLSALQMPFGPEADQLELTTSKPFEFQVRRRTEPFAAGELPISGWVVGSNRNLSDLEQARTPVDFLRASRPKSCAILLQTPAGCYYHSCQTSKTTSGAGLFVPSDEGYELVATHKGAISAAAGCEAAPPLDLQLNVAIAVQ